MFTFEEGTRPIAEVFVRMVKDREDNPTKPPEVDLSRATEE